MTFYFINIILLASTVFKNLLLKFEAHFLQGKDVLLVKKVKKPQPAFKAYALHELPTSCDDTLQMDHIWVIKLAHYAGLAQEVPSLFFSVAYFQCFYGHRHVPLSRQLQSSTAHLSKLSCETHNHPQTEFERSGPSLTPLPVPMVLNTYPSCRQQDSALYDAVQRYTGDCNHESR